MCEPEVGVWVDAWDESHSERMKEKTRGRAERSVGGAPGDGRDEKVPPGKRLPARDAGQ